MKQTDKITIYYFGDANNKFYECRVTTIKTFNKWYYENDKKYQDIAFILKGIHPKIESINYQNYLKSNSKDILNKWDIIAKKDC